MVHMGWLYATAVLGATLGMIVMALCTVNGRGEAMRIRFYFTSENTGSTETQIMEFPEGTPDQEIQEQFDKWHAERRSEYAGWEAY